MDFQTPRPSYASDPSGFPPGLCPVPMEDNVFAAQFAAFVAAEPTHGYSASASIWSDPSSPSYSVDTSAMTLDSADESVSSSSAEGKDAKAKASKKSKRASRYQNCPDDVLIRRREQNRANQRAYRKRKEQRLEELQDQINEMSQKNEALACSCSVLSKECARLRARLMPGEQQQQQQQHHQPQVWTPGSAPQGLDIAALAAYYTKISSTRSVSDPCLDYPQSSLAWSS